MSKSAWKNRFLCIKIFKKFLLSRLRVVKLHTMYCKSSFVTKLFLKRGVNIHKGNSFIRINFNRFSLGYRLGEFAMTRKPFSFPQKKKKR